MSRSEPDAVHEDTAGPMPPALSSMIRVVRLGYRAEPRLLLASLAMTLLQALPDVLVALWLALITDGLVHHHHTRLLVGAVRAGRVRHPDVGAPGHALTRTIRRLGDRLNIMFQGHVARLQAEVATVEHHERPVYLDRIAVLRTGVFALDHLFASMFTMVGWLVRLAFVSVLLAAIHPAAAPPARPAARAAAPRRGVAAQGREAHGGAVAVRRSPRPPPLLGRDLATAGQGDPGHRQPGRPRRASAYRVGQWFRAAAPGTQLASAAWMALAWAFFSVAVRRGGGLGGHGARRQRRFGRARADRRRPALGVRRLGGRRARLPARHLARLRPAARLARGLRRRRPTCTPTRRPPPGSTAASRSRTSRSSTPARPGRCSRTSTSCCRPAAWSRSSARTAPASRPSSSCWPACTPRPPAAITADGVDIGHIDVSEWRERLAGAFQDFARLEFVAATTVGLGDEPRHDDRAAVGSRRRPRRGRPPWSTTCADGLDTQLGPSWDDGVDVSFGQWQKLALARGYMRSEPLLLMLDEPTAALDAETEHALFERFAVRRPRGERQRPGHGPGVPPVLDRADGRPDRRARRRPGRRGRQPRRADGPARHLRRALLHPGRELRLRPNQPDRCSITLDGTPARPSYTSRRGRTTLDLAPGTSLVADGTHYDDVLIGTDQNDSLQGTSGNDLLEGRGGNDSLIGGIGHNTSRGNTPCSTWDADASTQTATYPASLAPSTFSI